jgi:2-keto-3-deoxy-L-rhamnonate aldolase RhmA
MAMKLMYITNNPTVAKAAEFSGVNWIFVDMEHMGKEERQPNMDTVKSHHNINDIKEIKKILTTSELIVRINPIHENTKSEIDDVIKNGADIIMLPYFKTNIEVQIFLNYVNHRVKTCLLLETPEAIDVLDDILKNQNIDYIHIGLNDLHLGYKLNFMFELISNGTVEKIISKISKTSIVYGFGGIAGIGKGDIPAEMIIIEHYRLKSQLSILSRSFYKQSGLETNVKDLTDIMKPRILEIRNLEKLIEDMDQIDLSRNKEILDSMIIKFVERRQKYEL